MSCALSGLTPLQLICNTGRPVLAAIEWEQVGAYLKRSPSSIAARALDNPLTLSLARDSYTTQDPTVLTDPGRFPTEAAVRENLIDQLLITAYPDEHQRAQVTSWLAWIAHQMGTSRDLPWWEISTWIPQWKLHIGPRARNPDWRSEPRRRSPPATWSGWQ